MSVLALLHAIQFGGTVPSVQNLHGLGLGGCDRKMVSLSHSHSRDSSASSVEPRVGSTTRPAHQYESSLQHQFRQVGQWMRGATVSLFLRHVTHTMRPWSKHCSQSPEREATHATLEHATTLSHSRQLLRGSRQSGQVNMSTRRKQAGSFRRPRWSKRSLNR